MDKTIADNKRTFVLSLESRPTDCPHTFTFKNMSPLEQVAVWEIVKKLAEKEQMKIVNGEKS